MTNHSPHPPRTWVTADRRERIERHQRFATAPATECVIEVQGKRRTGLILDLDDGEPALLLLHARCNCGAPTCLGIVLNLWLDRHRAQVADLDGTHVTDIDQGAFGLAFRHDEPFVSTVATREEPGDPWWPSEAEFEIAHAINENPAVQAWRSTNPTETTTTADGQRREDEK